MIISRFVISKPNRSLYYTDELVKWSMYIERAKTYKTYEEAQAALEDLEENFYQIDKIFKVKKDVK